LPIVKFFVVQPQHVFQCAAGQNIQRNCPAVHYGLLYGSRNGFLDRPVNRHRYHLPGVVHQGVIDFADGLSVIPHHAQSTFSQGEVSVYTIRDTETQLFDFKQTIRFLFSWIFHRFFLLLQSTIFVLES
jgi:hypothetical protein